MRDLMGKAVGLLGFLAIVTLLLPNAQFAAAAPKRSLYDRLGGKTAITAVVDEFVANVAADNRINKFFAKTNIPRLKQMLVDQICEASG